MIGQKEIRKIFKKLFMNTNVNFFSNKYLFRSSCRKNFINCFIIKTTNRMEFVNIII